MIKIIVAKKIFRRVLSVALVTPLMHACSQSSDDSETNSMQLADVGLGPVYRSLVLDAFQPESIDRASAAVHEAQLLINHRYFDNFAKTLPVSTPIVDTFDCDRGTVSRSQSGNPVTRDDYFEFSDCQLLNKIHNGKVALSIVSGFCTDRKYALSFEYYTVDELNYSVALTGDVSYDSSSEHCGSSAGGPRGESGIVDAIFSQIQTTVGDLAVAYSEYELNNARTNPSLDQTDSRLALTLETTLQLQSEAITLTISTPTSIVISDSPSEANAGSLTIAVDHTNSNASESFTYANSGCDKDRVDASYSSDADGSVESTITWFDENNILSQIKAPSLLTYSSVGQAINFDNWDVPYNAIQDTYSCQKAK